MKVSRLVLIPLLVILLVLVTGLACGNSDIPPSEGHPYWEHFGKQPPYSKSQFSELNLINNEYATDPTWSELKGFLLADKTDEKTYISFSFPCGAFAEEVHNNAEQAGIYKFTGYC
jgi:hypothetical protein